MSIDWYFTRIFSIFAYQPTKGYLPSHIGLHFLSYTMLEPIVSKIKTIVFQIDIFLLLNSCHYIFQACPILSYFSWLFSFTKHYLMFRFRNRNVSLNFPILQHNSLFYQAGRNWGQQRYLPLPKILQKTMKCPFYFQKCLSFLIKSDLEVLCPPSLKSSLPPSMSCYSDYLLCISVE